ncbi:MAG: threonine synthase [Candidatus Omnitrophica bacterium]|nr:threonine synthase [Candidatus Omnitrophota bacterium]
MEKATPNPTKSTGRSWSGLIEEYRRWLPVSDTTPVVTLHEGATPLIPICRLAESIDPKMRLFVKYEGLNPTGSFKDRGMTMAMSKALEEGYKSVICASTGNTSASAAAYAARAGMGCIVLLPEGAIAMGKLAQACMHGARVIAIRGNFDDAFNLVREIVSNCSTVAMVNSVNPFRLEGQKTAAFEICDTLGGSPDYHAIPVGNAGNITAYWMGYTEYQKEGLISDCPKMLGFQAAGAAPIYYGKPIEKPETIATAIRIGNPASWKKAEAARDESGGLIDIVTDEEILEAQKELAREGVFVEPASAASIAGLKKIAARGYFADRKEEYTVTATVTGHGLKDPDTAINQSPRPITVDADLDSVLKKIEDLLQ